MPAKLSTICYIYHFTDRQTTEYTVKEITGVSRLDDNDPKFHIEENIGEREPKDFWVEAKHGINHPYLTNKTTAINQNMRSTTAILTGTFLNTSKRPLEEPWTLRNDSWRELVGVEVMDHIIAGITAIRWVFKEQSRRLNT
ncbi:hypothetical protein C1645_838134 [Glomus cerebriforme]|uniref:Uncharacterized protein n=1 Tax=Glomus cerebriforme TaxID=658196 RepID=A0A397SDE0_9GLOM|nr:hypothetical protein C1645_838134 [Glomus cerebriforme]